MTRDFFFLRDSFSGQFYTGQHNWMSSLRNAAVYHSEKSAIEHIKGIVSAWEHDKKYPTEEKYRSEFTNQPWPPDLVREREGLPKWGVVVCKGTLKI